MIVYLTASVLSIILIVIVLLVYTNTVEVVRVQNQSEKLFLKYVVLSDIHGKTMFLNGSLCSIVNAQSPDFVIVAGDLITFQKDADNVFAELGKLKCQVFWVLGNYERASKARGGKVCSDTQAIISKSKEYSNLNVLINEEARFCKEGRRISIYGFDNSVYGNEYYNPCLEANYSILVAHSPNIIKYIDSKNIKYDHLITGHTHGGQINLSSKILRGYSSYHSGDKVMPNKGIFTITKGLGTVKIPFRFRARPEVRVYELSTVGISASSDCDSKPKPPVD